MAYTRPYGSGGFKDTPDTSTPITAAALNTIDVGVANAHTDIANTLATIPSRNRIVNGAMMVDQRNAGAAITSGDGSFAADRFVVYKSAATLTLQRLANDGPAGVSPFSIRVTNGTAPSLVAGSYHTVEQRIEGYNIADLGFGTASPQPFVLSFYVKSSVTGTFPIAFKNATPNRSYVSTYTINAANTWERKTIAVTADAAGTWNVDNSLGLFVVWGLGSGSTFQTSSLNAWQATNVWETTTSTRFVSTTGATWQISGVQLEYGTTPTRFEHRSYDDELRRCQRYYEVVRGGGRAYGGGGGYLGGYIAYKVTKRINVTPTFGTHAGTNSGPFSNDPSALETSEFGTGWQMRRGGGTDGDLYSYGFTMTVSAEL